MQFFQVDSFTSTPFAGNPAAICFPEEQLSTELLQQIAIENNLSETAFVWERENGHYDLRWFTPAYEVDLCGHATLAAAHVLWEIGCQESIIRFKTRSGELSCRRELDLILMDFPAVKAAEQSPQAGLIEALGCKSVLWTGKNKMDWLIEIDSIGQLRELAPDFGSLKNVAARGVIVTARADTNEYDFLSRFFAPAAGIDEDPVTGSAHCSLAPYWAAKLNKNKLAGFQASARGGEVSMHLESDRVQLGGHAVTVIEGKFRT